MWFTVNVKLLCLTDILHNDMDIRGWCVSGGETALQQMNGDVK